MTEATSGSATSATQAASDTTVTQDIDTAEAFKSGVHTEARSWNFNTKALADRWATFDIESARAYSDLNLDRARKAQTMWEDQHSELMKDMAEIRGRRMKQFDDATTVSFQEAQRTVRQGDIASDRQWNIDEVSDLSAKSGLQADAIAATIVKAVADALTSQVAKKSTV
jgi:hypothetical protein